MSEEPAPQQSDDVAMLTRRFERQATAQLLLGVAAIIISAAALWASYVQADATRKTQEASALPAIQLDLLIDDTFSADRASVVVQLHNVGVGPARIQSWRALVNGEPLNEQRLMAALPAEVEAQDYSFSAMQNRLLAPGAAMTAASLYVPARRETVAALVGGLRAQSPRIEMEACYCSVFEQCWTTIQIVGQQNRAPVRDDRCEIRLESVR